MTSKHVSLISALYMTFRMTFRLIFLITLRMQLRKTLQEGVKGGLQIVYFAMICEEKARELLLGFSWESLGSLLGVSWESLGSLSGVSRESLGSLSGVSRESFGSLSGSLRILGKYFFLLSTQSSWLCSLCIDGHKTLSTTRGLGLGLVYKKCPLVKPWPKTLSPKPLVSKPKPKGLGLTLKSCRPPPPPPTHYPP